MPFTGPTLYKKGRLTICDPFFCYFHGLYCPNSIKKALLPHMSSFLLTVCLYLPNSLSRNFCQPNTSFFQLITYNFLAQFCIRKSIVTPYELFSDTYMKFTLPILYQKPVLPCPILYQKSFVNP